MTNTLRLQPAPKGITTTALHVGYMDTDMVAQIDSPKGDPAVIAALALDGVQAGAFEVVADEKGKMVRSLLSAELPALYPELTDGS
jgi:NAD(P)-dependent dehydrogenase (short-subunit alcohol dehydrogenase family)